MTSTPCISLDSPTVGVEVACKNASSVVQAASGEMGDTITQTTVDRDNTREG